MDKDKVLQLAKEAEILRQLSMEVPFVIDRLERFAALIEREVRGDAEPVAWMMTNKTYKDLSPSLHWQPMPWHITWEAVPLYTHPTPAVDAEPVTVLPDGSAFAVMSFPLPKDHWLYAQRQYRNGEYEPIELGKPILTHEMRDAVVSAVRYAVRGATNCGKDVDFDPDALVQNAVYALCGAYGTLKPKQEQSPTPALVRQLVEAAKRAMNYAENVVMAEGVYFDDDDDLPFIESTLLAAKEAGL